jgi:glycosyltransferase involved in cell wall biosynthesis
MRNAAALLFPSEWYEGSPMAVSEALACGTPVIGGALGGLPGMVTEGHNGLIFQSGNAADMAACIARAFHCPSKLAGMRTRARRSFEEHFNARDNLKMLLSIYQSVLAKSFDTADVFAAL